MKSILRVNVTRKEATKEDVPAEYRLVGGRCLIGMILGKEVNPRCDPLGADNKLIMAPGLLAGTMAPSFGRMSVGAKSPLTQGIKEANVGGTAAQKMDRLGIKAVVIEGEPDDRDVTVLRLNKNGVEFIPAQEMSRLGNYDTVARLQDTFGKHVGVVSIGPCGEMGLKSASVAVTDSQGRPSRHAARGGLGAVMGAKGIKAVVIDAAETPRVAVLRPERFKAVVNSLVQTLIKDESTPKSMSAWGTPHIIPFVNAVGSMPTKNFRLGSYERAGNLEGEMIRKINAGRGGSMSGCMPGCVIRCSINFHGVSGEHITSALEYETLAMLGSNLDISDVDVIAKIDRRCDDLGLDTIEIGNALSQAMSIGRLAFGDGEAVLRALDEIERETPFGRVLGNGTVALSKEFGITRVPAVMNQGIPAHDPRACKAAGVTYTTSAMGADHTAGIDYRDSLSSVNQVNRSKMAQIFSAMLDSVGYCLLALPTNAQITGGIFADLINARYGTDITEGELFLIGMKAIQVEHEFNRKAGIDYRHLTLPEWLRTEALLPRQTVFDVKRRHIETIWDDLPDWLGKEGPLFLQSQSGKTKGTEKGRVAVFAGKRRPFIIRKYPLADVLEDGAAVIKISLANICGSDLHMWRGEAPCPPGVVFGHEMTGKIYRRGPGLNKDANGLPLKEGDRVVVPYSIPCGACVECVRGLRHACQNKFNFNFHQAEIAPHFRGAYGEYFYSPPGNPIFRVPDSICDESVAALNCACSQVLYGLSHARIRPGDSVVVQGAGGLGIYAVALSKVMGAGKVICIDQSPRRLQLAKEFGADVTLDLSGFKDARTLQAEIKELTDGIGADWVVGVAGTPSAFAEGIRMLAPGRTMIEMGNVRLRNRVDIDPAYIVTRGLTIKAFLTYEPWALGASIKFIEQNMNRWPFDKIVSTKFPFEKIDEAFELADKGDVFRVSLVFDK